MTEPRRTWFRRFVARECGADAILDEIDAWHEQDEERDLYAWLSITAAQLALFVDDRARFEEHMRMHQRTT
jgi:hypothetical protein